MLGQQIVLRATFEELAVGVDEQYLALPLLGLAADAISAVLHPLAQHQNAGGDAGAIEEVGGDADDGFEQVILDDAGANGAFFSTPEQHTVGQHRGHHAAIAGDGQHVLQEHQIGLLGAQRHLAIGEALGFEFGFPGRFATSILLGIPPVDGEWRIGKYAVEVHQFTAFHVLWFG
ncbi:hypothetical protein D3C77_272300 [compost metagenome]